MEGGGVARHELQREIRDEQDIRFALAWAEQFIRKGLKGGPVLLSLGRPRRSLDQNAKLWPMLTDVSRQCKLVVDGEPVKASPEDWKDVFTAALRRHQRVAKGIDGGLVFLGMRTSRMSKREFSDLIELIYAYGAEHGVEWSEPAQRTFSEHRRME